MRGGDIARWRSLYGLDQASAAALCGRKRHWLIRIETGRQPVPRWLNYLVAWTMLYGLETPYTPEQFPERLTDTRKRWVLTQTEIGNILGIGSDHIGSIEGGHPRPLGLVYALAWIRLYGSRLPFPD